MKSWKNERGAVFVMATFTGLLLVAVVLHVSGVGQAALEQATMQDAADATALSAAAANARGLNIIALINLVMAAILAVLVALRLAQALATVLVVGVAVGCVIPQTAALFCGFVEPANEVRSTLGDAAEEYEDIAKEALELLHDAAEQVNDLMPYVAQAEALAISSAAPYSPPATGGVVWPFTDGLPTVEGSFETLCKKAAENVLTPVVGAFGPVGEVVEMVLGEALEELAGTFTDYFCGGDDSGGSQTARPKETLRRDVGYPVGKADTDARQACAAESARVNPEHGTCDWSRVCVECAVLGCEDCFGDWSKNGYKNGLWTVVRDEWVEWTDDAGSVHRSSLWPQAVSGERALVQHSGNPCAADGAQTEEPSRNCHLYTEASWASSVGSDGAPGPSPLPFAPVCEVETRRALSTGERSSYTAPQGALLERVRHESYLVLSGCVIEQDLPVEAQGEPVAGSDEERSSMAPRELDRARYEQESTMRAIVLGERRAADRTSEVDLFDHGASSKIGERLSVAAAEYYSMDSLEEAMWHMRWLSRLVRFTTENAASGSDESSQKASQLLESGLLGNLSDEIGGSIDDYILH